MRLWTIQSKNVYEIIQTEGFYRCNPDLSPLIHYDIDSVDTMFSGAYDWMAKQMKKRIGKPPAGVKYPVWAWHTWDSNHKRPDMRLRTFLTNEDSVLMEIDIPDKKVLLSDEDAWHIVLNHCYYYQSDDSTSWDEEDEWFESLSNKEKNKELLKSWNKIFDVSSFENNTIVYTANYIQATFWELRKEQILKKWDVKARYGVCKYSENLRYGN